MCVTSLTEMVERRLNFVSRRNSAGFLTTDPGQLLLGTGNRRDLGEFDLRYHGHRVRGEKKKETRFFSQMKLN